MNGSFVFFFFKSFGERDFFFFWQMKVTTFRFYLLPQGIIKWYGLRILKVNICSKAKRKTHIHSSRIRRAHWRYIIIKMFHCITSFLFYTTTYFMRGKLGKRLKEGSKTAIDIRRNVCEHGHGHSVLFRVTRGGDQRAFNRS